MLSSAYSVKQFLKELMQHYLLEIGNIEFASNPDHMKVWDKESSPCVQPDEFRYCYLGDTRDEFGFSTGIHHIKVEGGGRHCVLELDVVPGFMTVNCPDAPSSSLNTK